jgi:RHS repeat-associated protein
VSGTACVVTPTVPTIPSGDTVWVGDTLPTGASIGNTWGYGMVWTTDQAADGTKSLYKPYYGSTNILNLSAIDNLNQTLGNGQSFVAYVLSSSCVPPREIRFKVDSVGFYWGGGMADDASFIRIGNLPTPGQWTRLEVPLSQLGISPGTVSRLELSYLDGQVWFDHIGLTAAAPPVMTGLVVTPASATIAPGATQAFIATASYDNNTTANVTATAVWASSSATVATVSSTGVVTGVAGGISAITATFGALSSNASVTVASSPALPPDPATVAPPIDPTVITTTFDSTSFLYTGANPIQTGVAANTIDPVRAAVVRGRLLTRDLQPLPGAQVVVAGHPELGSTLSRADGGFDLAVNGGELLTIRFAKSGWISADRTVTPPQNDFLVLPDVALVPYDTAVSSVDLTATGIQIARGNIVGDVDGQRRATLLFKSGTTATMLLPNGSTQALTSLHIRATEFTVGPNGPKAMPAPLPPTSGYTYCVDLSADEALAAGATTVNFSQPVSLYFENFLNFPVGTIIPSGFYDPATKMWVPSTNGRVIRIVAITLGLAYIDVDGDGYADSPEALTALGIDDAERQKLTTLYGIGATLWRVPVAHFSIWDANVPAKIVKRTVTPRDSGKPKRKKDLPKPVEKCVKGCGSIISVENRSLGEVVPLNGTSLSLRYESGRFQHGANDMTIPLTGPIAPPADRIVLELTVAGQQISRTFAPAPNLSYHFTWNEQDAYGRPLNRSAPASVRIGYVYKAVYAVPEVAPEDLHKETPIFAAFGNQPITTDRDTLEYTMWEESSQILNDALTVGNWNPKAAGFGGWTLDAQHFYDYSAHALHLGNGEERRLEGIGPVLSVAAGGVAIGEGGDGNLAVKSTVIPREVVFAPDGTFYINQGQAIRWVDRAGIIHTVAGGGNDSDSDGIAATSASLDADAVAIARDGSIYLSEPRRHRIRVIRGGVISTVPLIDPFTAGAIQPYGIAVDRDGALFIATGVRVYKALPTGMIVATIGNGTYGREGDGGPAASAALINPTEVAVAPDGAIYVSTPDHANIRRITPDGIVYSVVSGPDGTFGSSGFIRKVNRIAVDTDGVIYAATGAVNGSIVAIQPDGSSVRVAGLGSGPTSDSPVGAPALQARIGRPVSVAIGPDGALYFPGVVDPDSVKPAVFRSAPSLPGLGIGELSIASEDGSEYYVFSATGRHLRTVDALTGVVTARFLYDSHGLLSSVQDANDNALTIERNANLDTTAIVAPGGQRTTFSFNAGGFLATATNPAGETVQFTYGADGLMQTRTDARNNASTFVYDANGLLTFDGDAATGSTTLSSTGDSSNYTVTRLTAEGRQSVHHVIVGDDGSATRITTDTAGLQTTSTISADGTSAFLGPDGTTSTSRSTPDARFGMQASVASRSTISFPSGRSLTTTANRTVTLSAPDSVVIATMTESATLNGHTFSTFFDAAQRTFTTTSAVGRTSTTSLDAKGQVASVEMPGITPATFSYDTRGRLTAMTQGTRSMSYSYDTHDRLTTVTDPLNRTVSYAYDDGDRVTTETLPDQRVISFRYDANGNLAALTPPSRPDHAFTYSPVDLQTTYVPPPVTPGGSTLYSYNKDRQLTVLTRPDGRTLHIDYDGTGRAHLLTIARGAFTIAHNSTTGHVDSVTAPDGGAIAYSYDGPLLTSATWTGAIAGSISWTYDTDLALASEAIPCATATTGACQPVTFHYDADKLLTAVGSLALRHDSQNGQLTGTSAGIVEDSWQYDGFGAPVDYDATVDGQPKFSQHFTRDAAGRITTKSETVDSITTTLTYGYDTAGHLTDVTRNGTLAAHYTYDENGNRLTRQTSTVTESATVDAQDRLLTYLDAAYTYNANGDLATKTDSSGTTTYDYDELGNLLSVVLPTGHSIDYVIDAQNRRVGKKVDGVLVQRFLYSGPLQIAAELDADGNVTSRFVYSAHINVPDLIIKGETTYRVLTDHLGSPRAIVNSATGEVVERIEYDEFGNVMSDTNAGFQPFGFAGGLHDASSGLERLGARDYDPQIGRWTAKDPIGFGGRSANLYSYVGGDPVNRRDPTGRRDIFVTFWTAQFPYVGAGGSVGHTAAIEVDGKVIVSLFPEPHGMKGANANPNFPDTIHREGGNPDRVFRVHVPNDKAFDRAAASARNARYWDWLPTNLDQSNCVDAVSRALKAGGVPVHLAVKLQDVVP